MLAFDLLSEPIRRFIRDKRWQQLRPIQEAAITRILGTDDNYILISRTASGKTEAAFLPILSKIDFNETGVQVLYVSPLIALINDQFYRIEELCKNLEVPVTKWHGESNKTFKENLLKHPSGIVLITPESLEAMFVNKPYNVRLLFSNLKYVVIDEIHSFIGTDRGTQLSSLLARLQNVNLTKFSIVGLSATMSDNNKFIEAKEFTGSIDNTKILIDKTPKLISASFRFFKQETEELPLALLKDLYKQTKDNKVLIFPNSRGRVEEVAVKLKKISDKIKGHSNYFSHHSSVDKVGREYIEFFAKNNGHKSFAISCTSTLELGIDIGSVDAVVQIDATHSIASLIQRVGRSGRKNDEASSLFLYATDSWSLLQSLACWLLYNEGFIEPPLVNDKPYDILLHQALSISKGSSGIKLVDLAAQLHRNFAFKNIGLDEIEEIISHLVQIDLLEKIQNELIIGVEGENIVNHRDFYSVFKMEENFKVVNGGHAIGEVPYSPQIIENENILLAAKIWKITFVDFKAKKVEVVSAKDGKKPIFFGGAAEIHPEIRIKMMEILYSTENFEFIDMAGLDEIENLRKEFSVFDIQDISIQRPLLESEKSFELFTFTGTRVNRTIQLLFSIVDIPYNFDDDSSRFEIRISKADFVSKWSSLNKYFNELDFHINKSLEDKPALLDFSKWGMFLPQKFKISLLKNKYYDIEGTKKFLDIKLVKNSKC